MGKGKEVELGVELGFKKCSDGIETITSWGKPPGPRELKVVNSLSERSKFGLGTLGQGKEWVGGI